MEINRSRTRPAEQPKAIDGFFSKPSGGRPGARGAYAPPRRPVNGVTGGAGQPISRTLNDFSRTDGFHAAPRRAAGPAFGAATGRHISPQFDPQPAAGSRLGRKRPEVAKTTSKFRTFRKWAFRTTAFAMILVIAVGGLLFGKGYLKFKKVFSGSTSAAALVENVDPTKLKGEGDGRINILLLGIGGAAHAGGDLTDTIMIASVDPINNQAVLFSVPRDLWVKMPNNYISNYQKINAAYESGKYKYLGRQEGSNTNKKAIDAGFQSVDSTVERVMGVPIHYNALVDFHAFAQAVDTVGGVTINAPEQVYDPTMAWDNWRNPVLAKAGINNFDGHRALNYVRSRETSSDFARSQRQRAVLVALKDKVMNAGTLTNPVKLSKLLNAFGNNVQTDISLSDMSRMATIMKKIPNSQIQSVGLADGTNSFLTTGNINGLSVVEPRAGLEDYSKIQTFVRSKLKDGYISRENASITLLNGTVTPGLATEKGDELKSYGYNVVTVGNAPTPDFNETTIIDFTNGAKKYTLNYLKNRYHVQTVSKTLPPGVLQNKADIIIILGPDATINP